MDINATTVECKTSETDAPIFRFLILDAPSPSSLPAYIKELQKNKVKHLVRVCGPTYNSEIVEKSGIAVHGWPFDDGNPPPQSIIDNWLQLLENEKGATPCSTIAVHCVAGLGRAPILVALALVEYAGVQPLDAVGFVRSKRKGAINQVQLNWLSRYKPRAAKSTGSDKWSCCSTM